MTKKALFLSTMIVVLFLTGLVSQNKAIFLMAIPFLVYLGVAVYLSPEELKINCVREINSIRNFPNMPITVDALLENNGESIPRIRVIEDILPKMLVIDGSVDQDFSLSANSKIELRYTFQAPRGQYSWQEMKISASDPFGLLEKTLRIPNAITTLVLPECGDIKKFNLKFHNTIHTPGPNLSRLPGSGIDFWGVREYRPGDSLRLVDWRRTARNPHHFFSKEYEREEMADIGLLLDARSITNSTYGHQNLFEHSVQATATLAKYFLSIGNRVSMLSLGAQIVQVFPGYGKRQLVKILDKLALCQPAEKISADILRYLPVRLFPSHSMIILVSPLSPNDLETIKRFRSEGYQVLVVSPDPVQFIAHNHSKVVISPYAIRAARIERTLLLWKLRQMGVDLVNWDVENPLEKTLHSMNSQSYR